MRHNVLVERPAAMTGKSRNQGVRLLDLLTNLDPVGRHPTEYYQGVCPLTIANVLVAETILNSATMKDSYAGYEAETTALGKNKES